MEVVKVKLEQLYLQGLHQSFSNDPSTSRYRSFGVSLCLCPMTAKRLKRHPDSSVHDTELSEVCSGDVTNKPSNHQISPVGFSVILLLLLSALIIQLRSNPIKAAAVGSGDGFIWSNKEPEHQEAEDVLRSDLRNRRGNRGVRQTRRKSAESVSTAASFRWRTEEKE